jgi:hypothetical protein
MANTGSIDLTGDDEAGLHSQPPQPLQQQQQQQVSSDAAQEA